MARTIDLPKSEFTDAQLKRINDLEEAAAKFLSVLAETEDQVWDFNDIWELIYTGANRLLKRGRRVRIPIYVPTLNYIADWYGERG